MNGSSGQNEAWTREYNGMVLDGALYGFETPRLEDFRAMTEDDLVRLRRMGRRVGPQARRGEIRCSTWLEVADRYCDFDSTVAGATTLADEHAPQRERVEAVGWSDAQVRLPAKPKPSAFTDTVSEMQDRMAAAMGVPKATLQQDRPPSKFSLAGAVIKEDRRRRDEQLKANRDWLALQDEIQRHANATLPVKALAERCGATSTDVRRAIRALAQKGVMVPVKRHASKAVKAVASRRSKQHGGLAELERAMNLASALAGPRRK